MTMVADRDIPNSQWTKTEDEEDEDNRVWIKYVAPGR